MGQVTDRQECALWIPSAEPPGEHRYENWTKNRLEDAWRPRTAPWIRSIVVQGGWGGCGEGCVGRRGDFVRRINITKTTISEMERLRMLAGGEAMDSIPD